MTSAHIIPSPNRSLPPRFFDKGDKDFEHICRALFDKEPHLINVEFYGTRGQKQYGIDIIGHRHDGSGIEVVSCKCYELAKEKEFKTFSDDFLDHLNSHWKDWQVRRFVLAIAADTDRTEIQRAILTEVKRFMALGILYEVWNPAKLQELLRPHPGIVRHYLTEYWVGQICGHSEPIETPRSDPGALINATVVAQLAALQQRLAGHTSTRVEQALDRIRAGENATVEAEMRAIRNDAVEWSSLMPDVQAKVLRLIASCRLVDDDISEAETLADEADAIFPSEEPRLRALITLYRHGNKAALSVLGDPVTQDGANLRLAMLIEASDFNGAEEMLSGHPLLQSPDAETWRLRAHLHFERNDREAAVAAIRQAEVLKPDWRRVREDGGLFRYAAAVSGAARPATLRVPNPIDIDLIREDPASRKLLHEALEAFTRVLEGPIDSNERDNVETWRLAVLSARRDWSQAAADYAGHLLAHDPSHWGAIAWSLARGFPVDKKTALAAVESRLVNQTAEPPHLSAALVLCLSDDDTTEARRLFDAYSDQFPTENGKALMAQWHQRLNANGCSPAAERPMFLRIEQAIEQAQHSQDWSPLAALLAALADDEATLLLPVCQSLAAAGRWQDIVPHIEDLTGTIATAEAARLAVYAAYHSGKPKLALELIGRYPDLTASGELPVDLKRLEIEARAATGDILTALQHSEMLRIATAAPHDVMREADLAFSIGDLKRAEVLIGRPEITAALPAQTALVWAGRLKSQNPERATRLLRHATDKGLKQEAIPSAFHLALHLPDAEIAQRLAPAFNSLAQRGEGAAMVRSVSLDEMAAIVVADREDGERLARMHAEGKMAPHFASGRLRERFAQLYLRSDDEDTAVPFRRRLSPLWIRHGARLPVTLPEGNIFASALYVDISSLLLAEGIGLLDVLDNVGIALHLPYSLPTALVELEHHADDHQPDVIAAHGKLRLAIAARTLSVRDDEDLTHPTDTPRWRVVHDHRGPDDGTATIDNRGISIIPLAAIGMVLGTAGLVDGNEPPLEQVRDEELPAVGDVLFFEYNTIASLIDAGIFDATVQNFRVEIERRYFNDITAELARHDQNKALARRLGGLRDRTTQRLTSGLWRLAPQHEAGAGDDDMYDRATAVERCLLDLLRIPNDELAVVWIDDRFVNSHANADAHPIIGITDVLAALRTAGHIDDAQYYAFLLKLRRARAHFLPITPDEVLHHLRKASVRNDDVIETPALRSLRQHFADALLAEEFWDLPAPSDQEGTHRELVFALGLSRLFDQVMIPIWTADNIDLPQRTARLDWAWWSLRAHRFNRLPLAGETPGKRYFAALGIASLFSSIITIFQLNEGPGQQHCRNLIHWLDRRVLQPALAADPTMAEIVARNMASLIIGTPTFTAKGETDDIRQAMQLFIRRFVDILPKEIRHSLYKIPEFVAEFRIEFVDLLTFQGVSFENGAFWSAIARARSGKKARLASLDGAKKLTLSRPKRGNPGDIQVTGDMSCRLSEEPEDALLGGTGPSRRRSLEKHPEWFDLPPSELVEAIAEVAEGPTAAARMKMLRSRQIHSIPHRLARWRDAVVSREAVELSAPAPVDMLRYLRLNVVPSNPAVALAQAAEKLTSELGAAEAMRRLAYLPVPLSPRVIDGLAAMTPTERSERLARGPAGPLAQLQWLSLLRHFTHPDFAAKLDRLLEEWQPLAAAFLAVLHWANRWFAEEAEWRGLPGPYRLLLTWTHAGLVTETLLGEGVSPTFIIERFAKLLPGPRLDLGLIHDGAYDDSPLFPSVVLDHAALLYHGMAMVVGAEGERLSSAQRQRLEALLSFENEERRHPAPSLYRDWRMFDDPLGLMFMQRPGGIFASLPDVTWADTEQVIGNSLIALAHAPTSSDAWVSYLVAGGPPAFERSELLAILASLDVTELSSSLDSGDGFALRMAAEATARSRDTEAIKKFANGLFAGAAILAQRFPVPVVPARTTEEAERPAQSAAFHLLEAVAQLSKRSDLAAAVAFLADGLLNLAVAWPSATPYWRHVAEETLGRLPFDAASEMVRVWTILRTEA